MDNTNSEPEVYWHYENNLEVLRKSCPVCKKSLYYDRATAVTYRENVYHDYCLLTFLTDYHYKNSGFVKQPEANTTANINTNYAAFFSYGGACIP